MPPLLEKMAREALLLRIEKLERAQRANSAAIGFLTSALWHHIELRHQIKPAIAEGADVVAIRNARRTVAGAPKSTLVPKKERKP